MVLSAFIFWNLKVSLNSYSRHEISLIFFQLNFWHRQQIMSSRGHKKPQHNEYRKCGANERVAMIPMLADILFRKKNKMKRLALLQIDVLAEFSFRTNILL